MKSATHFWFDTRHEEIVISNLHQFPFGDRITFTAQRKDGKSNILVERFTNPQTPVDESQISKVEYYLFGYVSALKNMTEHFQALTALSEPTKVVCPSDEPAKEPAVV